MAMIGFFLVLGLSATVLVRGQQGFISIDCGIAENSGYINNLTGIEYVSDAQFIETGENHNISTDFQTSSLPVQNLNLRSFPTGDRNCYTLKDVQKGNKYMIRAGFMYGNFDGQNREPQFDIYLGVDHWDSMNINNASAIYGTEIMVVASANFISVCLVNTGFGPPFISTLELRPLRNELYKSLIESSYFLLFLRYDLGSTDDRSTRYPNDVYDRMWYVDNDPAWTSLNTSASINNQPNDGFEVPSTVMRTAATPLDGSNIQIFWDAPPDNPPLKYHIFLHFTEIKLLSEQSRIFDIYLNGNLWAGAVSPRYLVTDNIVTEKPVSLERYNITIHKAAKSTLPPILNAIEIYNIKQSGLETDGGDVDAIMEVKAAYQVKRNWMGDPCVPSNFTWDGLNCSFGGSESPRIIYLNLAHSELTGEITAALAKLESLRYLDLSGNNLSGPIPDALGELPYLEYLNLSSNQLTGSIPRRLLERSKDGSLKLSIGNNPALCYGSDSCEGHHKVPVPIVIVLSVAPVVLLVVAISAWMIRRKKQKLASPRKPEKEYCSSGLVKENNGPFQLESQQFTYKDLISITKDFEHAIGKGGFGTVYYGELGDGTQVAVKLRSQSSQQGTKEFQAEAQLLTRVHHRNLVSLVGYCKDENALALVYEYMAQGSLQEHLAGKTSKPGAFHWIERLRIALEAAQGLEYLHQGCSPSIIHRDVKTTNILLNHKREAKIADFGLSKVFCSDTVTHVSTDVVGTPGYVDPEYYYTYQLNEKSDVFSFGVVLLELITGQPALPKIPDRCHIIQWVRPLLARGDIGNVVDRRMEGEYDTNSVWKAAEIAMKCTLPTAIQRPTMSDVVMQLKDCLSMELACERTEILCMDGLDIGCGDSVEGAPKGMKTTLGPSAR